MFDVNEDRAGALSPAAAAGVGRRHHRGRRRGWLACSPRGASAGLATRVRAVAGRCRGRSPARCPSSLFIAVIALGWELVSLPFVFYRSFLLERKYGLSSEPLSHLAARSPQGARRSGSLLAESPPALPCMVPFAWPAISGGRWPRRFSPCAGVLLSRIAPVLLMPLFYRFRPLDREALRERLMTLSRRAGVPVLGAFEWGLGREDDPRQRGAGRRRPHAPHPASRTRSSRTTRTTRSR